MRSIGSSKANQKHCLNGFTNLSMHSEISADNSRHIDLSSNKHVDSINKTKITKKIVNHNRSFSQHNLESMGTKPQKLRLNKARYSILTDEHVLQDQENREPNITQGIINSQGNKRDLAGKQSIHQTNSNDVSLTCQYPRKEAVKLTDRSILPRATLNDSRPFPQRKLPGFNLAFLEKLSRIKNGPPSHRNLEIVTSAKEQQQPVRDREVQTRVIVKDLEVELKHTLAQQIIELINENEKLLIVSDSKLSGYLSKSQSNPSSSCLKLVASLQTDWKNRVCNIKKMFDLIGQRREASVPQNLLQTVYKTPKSLSKTIEFSRLTTTRGDSSNH